MASKAFLLLALLATVFLIASAARDLAEVSNPDEKAATAMVENGSRDQLPTNGGTLPEPYGSSLPTPYGDPVPTLPYGNPGRPPYAGQTKDEVRD